MLLGKFTTDLHADWYEEFVNVGNSTQCGNLSLQDVKCAWRAANNGSQNEDMVVVSYIQCQ